MKDARQPLELSFASMFEQLCNFLTLAVRNLPEGLACSCLSAAIGVPAVLAVLEASICSLLPGGSLWLLDHECEWRSPWGLWDFCSRSLPDFFPMALSQERLAWYQLPAIGQIWMEDIYTSVPAASEHSDKLKTQEPWSTSWSQPSETQVPAKGFTLLPINIWAWNWQQQQWGEIPQQGK